MAIFASDPRRSGGRAVAEQESLHRSPWQRDRDRVVHATAFRRLEYKTQVFMNLEGDHFRTRLTHSLEVAQIARSLARSLGGNEDLAEAIALAHDLGHPAFGHAGEEALDRASQAYGGFDHNLQTFRVLTELESRYAEFDGLNLTLETLEGVLKHNGPLAEVPVLIQAHPQTVAMRLSDQGPLEAQIAAIADDVAYCNHDVDDGLRAEFFTLDEMASIGLIGRVLAEVDQAYPGLAEGRRRHEVNRRMIDAMIVGIHDETKRRLNELAPQHVDELRAHSLPVVDFPQNLKEDVTALRAFLRERMYRHYKVNRMALKAQRIVQDLFAVLADNPQCLPPHWQARAAGPGAMATGRAVRDYIAGMTDRFALDEHERLLNLNRYNP